MEPVKSLEYRGYNITVEYDSMPLNPRKDYAGAERRRSTMGTVLLVPNTCIVFGAMLSVLLVTE